MIVLRLAYTAPLDHMERRDASAARIHAFRQASQQARRILYDRYAEEQIKLINLATHPDYWRRGAASKLCHWGLAKSKDEGVAITLLSSPIGAKLYSKFNFKTLGTVKMQVEGETETLEYPIMAYK